MVRDGRVYFVETIEVCESSRSVGSRCEHGDLIFHSGVCGRGDRHFCVRELGMHLACYFLYDK